MSHSVGIWNTGRESINKGRKIAIIIFRFAVMIDKYISAWFEWYEIAGSIGLQYVQCVVKERETVDDVIECKLYCTISIVHPSLYAPAYRSFCISRIY